MCVPVCVKGKRSGDQGVTLNFQGARQPFFVSRWRCPVLSDSFFFFLVLKTLFLKSKPAAVPLQHLHQAALRSDLD